MKTIVTGEVNTGKTSALLAHYETHQTGDGFASVKVMVKNRVSHYDAMRLSTKEKRMLTVHEQSYDHSMGEYIRVGPYRMLKETMRWVETTIKTLIDNHVTPMYFDEIGPLELSGKGFDNMVRALVAFPCVVVIRSQCLQEAFVRYTLDNATIIDVSRKESRHV